MVFFPCTFLMISIAKVVSSYLLLEMRDTFWHMWHHLDAVTWHTAWPVASLTRKMGGQNHSSLLANSKSYNIHTWDPLNINNFQRMCAYPRRGLIITGGGGGSGPTHSPVSTPLTMTSNAYEGFQNALVLPLFIIRDIFWWSYNKAMKLVSFSTYLRSSNSKMSK